MNGSTVRNFRSVFYIIDVHFWGVSTKWGSIVGFNNNQSITNSTSDSRNLRVWDKDSQGEKLWAWNIHVRVLALFSGHSCLQFSIACSMRGKAWEKESHVWRQVDVRGGGGGGRCLIIVTHKLCIDQPWEYRTNYIDAVFWMLQSQVFGQGNTRGTSRFLVGHCPPHG